MKPWEEAAQWLAENNGQPFGEMLEHYLNHGYVWSSNTEFILGKTVWVEDGKLSFDHPEPNAWYVQLAAGKGAIGRFLELAPFPLPYVVWQRRGNNDNYHIYTWEKYQRKVKYYGRNKNSSTGVTELCSRN